MECKAKQNLIEFLEELDTFLLSGDINSALKKIHEKINNLKK
jgi:hypothetical protein